MAELRRCAKALRGQPAASSILTQMADFNGKSIGPSPEGDAVRRSLIPAPPMHIKAIYTTDKGVVVGTVEIYGANDECFKTISKDLYSLFHKVVVTG